MRVPFTISAQNITVFVDGKIRTVLSGNRNFHILSDHLKGSDHDVGLILRLSDREATVRSHLGNSSVTVEDGVVYYKGEEIHNAVTDKLLNLLDDGFDAGPWIKFLENLMANPSFRSRSCLYNFLDHFNAPITPDGKFIAFKRVRSDWKDIHSGTMDNSLGRVVEMDRSRVDDDPQHTCSSGLHVCADEYLSGYATTESNRTLAVEVNPADVVAVPYDYNFAKMRVCRYKVLSEIDPQKIPDILSEPVYDASGYDLNEYYSPSEYH
jgi:hypothetical protein